MAHLITWPSNQSLPTCVFLKDIAECIVQSETDLFSASPTTLWQLSLTNTQVCRILFSMMRSEHHTGMHSFHNILISKFPLVFLEHNCKERPLSNISLHT